MNPTAPTIISIGDGPWPVKIEEGLAEELRSTMSDREIYLLISRHGPTTKPITTAKPLAMALENRAKGLTRENPGAWKYRTLYPSAHTYGSGYFRHLGTWTRHDVQGLSGDARFINEKGESPSYANAELWPG